MLTLSNLNAFYGRAQILFDLTLEANRGEVAVLLGRNGAGKSTTLKTIIGLVRPNGGSVTFDGKSIQGLAPYRINRLGIGYVPEERRIFRDLTVFENLEVGRQPRRDGAPFWTPERLFELFPNLGEMRRRNAGMISGGEQQMLAIARTLMGNPSLVLLDEPSEGLAPVIVSQMARAVSELKNEGLTVILSEQNFRFAEKVSDRVYIIEKGTVCYNGTMKELSSDMLIRAKYLAV